MNPGAVPMILCLRAMPWGRMGDSAGSVANITRAGLRSRSARPGEGTASPGGANQALGHPPAARRGTRESR